MEAAACCLLPAAPPADLPAGLRGDGEPVGAHAVPFLDEQALLLKEGADARGVPAGDFLQDGDHDAQGVVAKDGALGNGSDVPRLRNGNGEALAPVHMQHDVNVGPAVSDVEDAFRADLKLLL